MNILANLTAQDEYFFLIVTDDCTFEKIGLLRGWIFLEICIFYL
jgi:hypothetical protein